MTRAQLVARMFRAFPYAFPLLDLDATTVEESIDDVLDDALRTFGVLAAEDVPDGTLGGFLALARFSVLGWLLPQFATFTDEKNEAGFDSKRSLVYAQLSKEREELRPAAQRYDPAAGAGAATIGVLNLDWVEPTRFY